MAKRDQLFMPYLQNITVKHIFLKCRQFDEIRIQQELTTGDHIWDTYSSIPETSQNLS